MFPELRDFLRTISLRERRFVGLSALALMVVTSLPLFFAYGFGAVRGMVWTGKQYLSPGDTPVYFSYIMQVKQGAYLFRNLFTTEHVPPVLNIFWLGVGLFARAFSLSPLVAYYLTRTILIFPLCVVLYLLIGQCYRAVRERMIALTCVLWTSGVGLFFEPFFGNAVATATRYERPIDLWVSEGNTFLTVLYSPHFIASLTLFFAIILLLSFAWKTEHVRYGVAAGVCGLLLFQFHPFHAPTLYAIPFVYGAVMLLRKQHLQKNFWWSYALFVGISLPSVAYHYYLSRSSPLIAAMNARNVTLTPSLWHVAIGFGVWSIAWALTWQLRRRGYQQLLHWDFLCVWAIVQTSLLYSPLLFQRRLVEGLQFPLVMLGVPALCALYAWLTKSRFANRAYVIIFLAMILLSSNIYAVRSDIQLFFANYGGLFYVDRNETAVWRWIEKNVSRDAVVLASPFLSNMIPGMTGRTVFIGHWAMTLSGSQKQSAAATFYRSQDSVGRAFFLKENNIGYVLYGPRERSAVRGEITMSGLQSVFRAGDFEVFAVK